MFSRLNDCEEYCICGCCSAAEDLHCMYCCDPPARHTERAINVFLSSRWPDDDKRLVARAVSRLPPEAGSTR